jgi:CBS domain-containing protein
MPTPLVSRPVLARPRYLTAHPGGEAHRSPEALPSAGTVVGGGGDDPANDEAATTTGSAAPFPGLGTRVGTLRLRETLRVRPSDALAAARLSLIERGQSAATVVDGAGRPLGTLSLSDVARFEDDSEHALHRSAAVPSSATVASGGAARAERRIGAQAATVADAMSPLLFRVGIDAPLETACKLMSYEGVARLVVVDAFGRALGMLAALDVVAWITQSAGDMPLGALLGDAGRRTSGPLVSGTYAVAQFRPRP